MSAFDELSPIARHALVVSCMDSNVSVQLADPTTVERVSALLRSESPTDTKGRASSARPPAPPSITAPGAPARVTPDSSQPNREKL